MKKYIVLIISLFLAGMIIYGSISKFQIPFANPTEVVAKAQNFLDKEDLKHTRLVLFVSGMKQTGYMWLLLGISELLFGIMLLLKRTRLLGAIFLLPITLNILLFHLFLEPDEIGELIVSVALFGCNAFITLFYAARKSFLLVKD